jgi:hypothetical protein
VAIETTPLGFKKPDGNELVRNGENVIADNAQTAQDLIAELQTRVPAHFDGGTPSTVYASDQTIDGGTV